MKKNVFKRAMPLALAMMIGGGAWTIQANEAVEIPLEEGGASMLDLPVLEAQAPYFKQMKGKVTMVETLTDGRIFIRLEGSEGAEADFYIQDTTVYVDNVGLAAFEDIQIGNYMTAYYIAPLMMTMIYPPQYTPSVLVLQGEEEYPRVGVSLFDENRLNAEKDLIIHIGENTNVISQSGEAYEGSLDNKVLVIFYDIVQESYPAQTMPDTVIVLDMAPELPVAQDKLNPEDFDKMIIFVQGEYLEGAHVYDDGSGEVLFPLRPIAEALGFSVGWDGTSGRITLGVGITLSPGSTEYTIGRMAPQQMSKAPVVVDGVTYVPGDFIDIALGCRIDISMGIYNITEKEVLE